MIESSSEPAAYNSKESQQWQVAQHGDAHFAGIQFVMDK
jgi:hypothetical protein